MRRLLVLTCSFVLLLAACGDDGGTEDPGNEVQTAPLVFGDGDQVWLKVETGGGFVPMIANLSTTPSLLLFDDGRLVRRADEGDGVPPVVPRFEAVQLDETATADLLDQFRDVVEGPDPGQAPVTDNPTTTITLTTDGQTEELGIYAPGFTDGLTDEQVAARQAADDAIAAAFDIDGAEPYVPEEWFLISNWTGAEGGDGALASLDPALLASADEPQVCARIPADQVDGVLDALADVDLFAARGTEVALRPILTGEETCPEQFVER